MEGDAQAMRKSIISIITIILLCSSAILGLCKDKTPDTSVQEKIDIWAGQLTTSKGSRLLYEIGQEYGYRTLRGTKIIPILIQNLQPLIENRITFEGQGEYIGQCIEVLGHIGDERALPALKKINQPIAVEAIKEIQNSQD